ncbi:hypothetical protein K2Z84_32560 [Candidatus Binatia bacterium]|nr:hypothetical protein [Candidatus Binatia bacterium]
MDDVAGLVLVVVLAVSLWALRVAPGAKAAEQLAGIWHVRPWGRQVYVDFFGLEVMLALWMLSDASLHDRLVLAAVCVMAMPLFGASAAAAYWLMR